MRASHILPPDAGTQLFRRGIRLSSAALIKSSAEEMRKDLKPGLHNRPANYLLTGAESRRHSLARLIALRVAKAESQVTMDLDRAMKNPASAFVTPEALCESRELTAEQKRAVLLQWKDQLEQLQAADDEGMQKSEPATGATGDLLGRVTSILSRLDADSKQVSI